ncbi:MAG: virulence protein RhuM/Fic/DOC family protein [Bacilli bacterium]|nr:virulence protein RhuM/Fic/DOC family protein [Bacilli bacterium]
MKNEIILFENQDVKLEVNMKDETVWLSLDQMAKLFDRDRTVITRHINNVFKEQELDRNEVCAKFAHTTKHGALSDKTQTRELDYYNLDMIISVGYRVKSKNGVIFRKWANKILKDYLLRGYAINQRRLEYLEKTVKLIDIAGRIDKEIKGDEAKEIIKVINNYSNALNLLDDYDHKTLTKPRGTKDDKIITYENCIDIINKLRFNSDSNLFALERNGGLKAIIGAIYQSFDGNDLYPTIEEKAANFLYLITKNHTFIDGNKRIAATLFIYFLEFYNILYNENGQVIDNNTLVAITLLIAQSNPREKDILIDLVMNFLTNE